jgi:hypothetical protein
VQSVFDDFNERAKEVTDYMTFLKDLEQQTVKFSKDGKLSKAEDLFSGNVDAKLIREEVAEKYGFSAYTDNNQTRGGSDLLSIKTNRNYLAHGSVSFSDVGKDITATELVGINERVIEYLRQILNNINDYLVNQEYLDST